MTGPEPHPVRRAFHSQAKSCAGLGSPFMDRLMTLCAERLDPATEIGARVLGWPGDVGPAGQSVPLRLAGALHRLVLSGADPGLAAVYPPAEVPDDDLWAAVARALAGQTEALHAGLDRAPQTNEIRRSAALIPAALHLTARFDLPLVLSELGASAGLNLAFDRYALDLGDRRFGPADSPVRLRPSWEGPLPPDRTLRVAGRAGVDLAPVDVRDPDDRLRLLSYLWPDQPERLVLTRAAIPLGPPVPDAGDAADWLARRLVPPRPGALHLVYHTVAAQYFPETTARAVAQALDEAGARATPDAPLAHLGMEADGQRATAALTLRLWPGDGRPIPLARVDFHGRRVIWTRETPLP